MGLGVINCRVSFNRLFSISYNSSDILFVLLCEMTITVSWSFTHHSFLLVAKFIYMHAVTGLGCQPTDYG